MIEFYPQIRLLHITLAIATGTLFALRGVLVLQGRDALANHEAVRWLSYTIDTSLLTVALLLLTVLHLSVTDTPWLLIKLVLLVVYIVLGSLALRRAPTPRSRRICLAGAVLTYLLIFGIARAHDPLGWFAG